MKFLAPYAIFIIPVSVAIIAQAIKFVLYSLKHGWDIRYAFTHGHMPSAHTAFAVSLVTSIGFYDGIQNGTFAVAFALAFLIIATEPAVLTCAKYRLPPIFLFSSISR